MIYICEECRRRIEEGDEVLIVKEAETNRLVYVAHRDCAHASFLKMEDKDDGSPTRQ